MFLREYDAGSYIEIGQGTLSEADWQEGTSTWVQKTISIPGVNWTVSAGKELEVKIIVNGVAGDDMWFAYDTMSFDTRITIP